MNCVARCLSNFSITLFMLGSSYSQCAPADLFPLAQPPVEVGPLPQSAAIADLDQDGAQDLVVGSLVPQVSVLPGNGDGTFQPGLITATTGVSIQSVRVADLDMDGFLDVVAAVTGQNEINVLLGQGNGTLDAAIPYAVGTFPLDLCVEDFDADGILDLATCNFDSGDVTVLLGTGSGSFVQGVSYSSGGWPTSITGGDFNQDGQIDLAVANQLDGTISVLNGNGDGTFAPGTLVSVATPTWIGSYDLDGDGLLDLVVCRRSGPAEVCLLRGIGDGTFNVPECNPVDTLGPISAAVADLNADGWLDVAVSRYEEDDIRLYLGTAGGLQVAGSFDTGEYPVSVVVGNLAGGDQALDLIVPNSEASSASVFLNQCPEFGFVRGDSNSDSAVDISDAVYSLEVLFGQAAPMLLCDDASDANDDGRLDVSDPIAVLTVLFSPSSAPLPAPFFECGSDPTPDQVDCETPSCPFL